MEFDCDRLADILLDLATGRLGSADRRAAETHLATCPSCAERVRRCHDVIAGLDAWEVPAPPEDLVERTLAAVEGAGVSPGERRRRAPSPMGIRPPTVARVRWGWRTGLRAAAAAAIVFACALQLSGDFVPRIQERIEDAQLELCAQQLSRLGVALHAYRRDHGEVPASLEDLMAALLKEGYVTDPGIFRCPAHADGGEDGMSYPPYTSYMDLLGMGRASGEASSGGGRATAPGHLGDCPVLGDRPGNHAGHMQVLYLSGVVETIELDALHVSMAAWTYPRTRGGG
ncbi:MAG: hypothetical protein HY722_16865 [Planctomycetes bacterium]|nr:hypothetical protein [Planctomycetota bacterium]